MTRRLVAAVAALLAALTLITGSPASATDGPMYDAPTAGRCYDVSADALVNAASTTAPTVPCSSAHRAFITTVAQVPATIAYGTAAFYRFRRQTCTPAVANAFGNDWTDYARSTYFDYNFLPTEDEQSHGAHWLTCLMVREIHLGIARTTGKPTLPHPLPARYQACVTSHLYMATCADPHKYRTVAVVTMAYADYTSRSAETACIDKVPGLAKDNDWVDLAKAVRSGGRVAILCLDN